MEGLANMEDNSIFQNTVIGCFENTDIKHSITNRNRIFTV